MEDIECDDLELQESLKCSENLSPTSHPNTPLNPLEKLRIASQLQRVVPGNVNKSFDAICGSPVFQDKNECICFSSTVQKKRVVYEKIAKMGAGAFGIVYKCRDSQSQDVVAIKHIQISDAVDGCPQSALREIALLRRCSSSEHPNIISLLDVCYQPIDGKRCELYLVLEFCEMDLKVFIRKQGKPGKSGLSPPMIKNFLHQMLKGMDFLHVIAVAHRDLKPQNVLVKNNVLKIADFGLGKIMSEHALVSLEVVTLYYRPPEVLLNVSYSLAVDMWSIGCILGEMCNNQVLLKGDSEINQLKEIFSVLGVPPEEDWPTGCGLGRTSFLGSSQGSIDNLNRYQPYIGESGVDLMKNLLLFNPTRRFSTETALNHRFFHGFTGDVLYGDYRNGPPQMSCFNISARSDGRK